MIFEIKVLDSLLLLTNNLILTQIIIKYCIKKIKSKEKKMISL